MPLELYYRHGGLNPDFRPVHSDILRHFLIRGTAKLSSVPEAKGFKLLGFPKKVYLKEAERLLELGFLERVPRTFRKYRIPAHLLIEIGKIEAINYRRHKK